MLTRHSMNKADSYLDKREIRNVTLYRSNCGDLIKKGNYIKARKMIAKYLEKYSKDGPLNYMMGQVLVNSKEYEEALKYFYKVDEEIISNFKSYWFNVSFCLYNIGKYNEALETIEKHKNELLKTNSDFIVNLITILIRKRLGEKVVLDKGYRDSYLVRQLTRFNRDATLYHVKSHHINNVENEENKSIFNINTDLEYLYKLLESTIDEEYFYTDGNFMYNYCVAIPNVGMQYDNVCNFLVVVVSDNKKDIINFYPTLRVDVGCKIQYLSVDYNLLFPDNKKKEL